MHFSSRHLEMSQGSFYIQINLLSVDIDVSMEKDSVISKKIVSWGHNFAYKDRTCLVILTRYFILNLRW